MTYILPSTSVRPLTVTTPSTSVGPLTVTTPSTCRATQTIIGEIQQDTLNLDNPEEVRIYYF